MEHAQDFEDGFGKFQEWTKVDMYSLFNAGFECEYDDMNMTARIEHEKGMIFKHERNGITYAVELRLTMRSIRGKCCIDPNMLITSYAAFDPHNDDLLFIVKAGTNRFRIEQKIKKPSHLVLPLIPGIPGTGFSEHSYPFVQYVRQNGIVMLKEIAKYGTEAVVKYNHLNPRNFDSTEISNLRFLLHEWEIAGIFDQEFIKTERDDQILIIEGFSL